MEANRLYICGNGGSATDALHIVGELAKSFVLKRPIDASFAESTDDSELLKNLQGGLPAFALVENSALASAFSNDVNPEYVFAQQVYVYARKGDCVLGISTSGNSKNVFNALKAAKARGAVTLALTGGIGGKMKTLCECCVCVPETETYKIQELHLPVYHALCLMLEQRLFGNLYIDTRYYMQKGAT
ncbi:phosphoheptose isomerase [Clostridia bacterium]|nr:phosphoheptose isomerase [Clostridia bacterium]GHV35282.1 phosphoheptose isomerase [Clostridia bacterium]